MCLLLWSKATLTEAHNGDFRVLRANIHKSTKSVCFNRNVGNFYLWNFLVSALLYPTLGGLFRGSFWKLQIWHVRTHTYIVLENIPFSTKVLLILLMSVYFCKKSVFSGNNSTYTQSNIVRAVLEIFLVLFSFFVK